MPRRDDPEASATGGDTGAFIEGDRRVTFRRPA